MSVAIHVVPDERVHHMTIDIYFNAPFTSQSATIRTILSELLLVSNKLYTSPLALEKKSMQLYGATLHCETKRLGEQHILILSISCVHLQNAQLAKNLIEDILKYLKELILQVNLTNQQLLMNSIQNLFDYYNEQKEDKEYVALNNTLKWLTTEHVAQFGEGNAEDLKHVSIKMIQQEYEKMLSTDTIDVFIFGNIPTMDFSSYFTYLPIKRSEQNLFINNSNWISKTQKIDYFDEGQCKVISVYRYNQNLTAVEQMSLNVLSYYLGGSFHSLLFQIIREQNQLAYYIHTTLDTTRGLLYIESGIDYQDLKQYEQLLSELMQDIFSKVFSEDTLKEMQRLLKQEFLLEQDQPLENSFALYRYYITYESASYENYRKRWLSLLKKVNTQSIDNVKQKLNYLGTYILN